jgi:DNA-binding response OmpR family regulator
MDMSDPIRVVVVDDDPDLLQSFAESLTLEGLDVHTAANATQALTTVRETSPHCVLLDILLPNRRT